MAMYVGCANAPDNADDLRPVSPEIAAILAARIDAETAHLPGSAVVDKRDSVFEFAFDQTGTSAAISVSVSVRIRICPAIT